MTTNVDDSQPGGQGEPAGARPGEVPAPRQGALPLIDAFPGLERVAPRIPLATLPTPVERLPLEGRDAWIKRDDRTSGVYGGNKVRKLEFLLAAARDAGAQRLITVGAFGSHHALATTVHGRAHGFDVTVVLLPQVQTDHVRAVLDGMTANDAEVRRVRSALAVPAGVAAARMAHRRERVRVIAPGGSDARGTLGYVNAALELERQVAAGECPAPAEIHVAGGTLGTAVGLALGLALSSRDTIVVAHRITSRAITNRRTARRLAADTLALLRAAAPGAPLPTPDDVLARLRIEHGQIGRGYGFETEAGAAARAWFAARAGLELDATYTAKAAAGFLAAAGRDPARPLLYWHTLSGIEPPAAARPAV